MSRAGDKPVTTRAGLGPGDVVAGKYVIDRALGAGGMGTVVAAQHVTLREPVALKFLNAEAAQNPSFVARFVREARAAVRIKSEHVARVLDVGSLENGEPFIVMELLMGTDLHRLSAKRGPLPWAESCGYIAQACEAVSEAHLYGIVHRDLKPANLFLTRRADGSPLVKVLDFGISKMAGEADENLTATTDVLGSPLYMSPEQIESPKNVDARADVWALGCILYKLLTGRAAFAAETASSSLAMIMTKPPPSLGAARPDVPPDLEALVMRCLEKDPKKRVQTADELGRALLPFAGLAVYPDGTTGASAGYSRSMIRTRSRKPVALVAVAITALAGAGVAAWLTLSRTPVAASAAPPVSATPPPVATATATAAAKPAETAAPTPTATASASAVASATAAPSAKHPPVKSTPRQNSDAFSDRL
jgi:serine/threonine-protein kinase